MSRPDIQKNEIKLWEDLYHETQQWKSNLSFMEDEITFFDHLLNSYAFQPNTPNLFERIQDYSDRLTRVQATRVKVLQKIAKHANDLGGMLESTPEGNDLDYHKKHRQLKVEVTNCDRSFQELKSEVFHYARGILKKRKPEK